MKYSNLSNTLIDTEVNRTSDLVEVKTRKVVFTGNENHHISLEDAARLTQRFRDSVPADAIKGGYFGRVIFENILAQKGCVGIRAYSARLENERQTFVLVGVISNGNDLWQGILGEQAVPCPPYCGEFNPLNSSEADRSKKINRKAFLLTGQENHFETLAQASVFTRNDRNANNHDAIKGWYFGKSILESILAQNGCVGIRFYFAANDNRTLTLVLVGVRSDGNDIFEGFLGEQAMPCPPYCGEMNPLNS
ncbi:MAG: hypothetical protein ACRDGA_00005 [Bacteroidota bacterium]